jgi:bifunctional non-homologous end joining protein LigD
MARAAARRPPLPARAVAAELPATLSPELATLVERPQAGDWLYEIKFDGYRLLARVGDTRDVRLVTRRGNDWTARFPVLRRELIARKLPPGWYDGEIVLPDARGLPDFNALQNAIEGGANERIVHYLFDAPFMHGHDLRQVPVEERRARLQAVLEESERVRFSHEIAAGVGDILASACKLGLEGVVGKRRGSPYVSRRSDDWIKLKCTQRQEFVIGGWTHPDGAPQAIAALLVGTFDERGVLQYAGKVGTGFTAETLARLRPRLEGLARSERPFAGATGHDRVASWVEPRLVCEVAYAEWPAGARLRHPSFQGLRDDKPAREVRREGAAPPPSPAPHATPHATPHAPRPAAQRAPAAGHGADRVMDPSTGLTKADLLRYYAQVARWMLPHLKGRPAYVKRAPEGLDRAIFFQQHPENSGLRGTDPRWWPGHEPAFLFEHADDLVAAAHVGTIEIHTWNSTAQAILRPDRMIFDLDPGRGVSWQDLREAAQLVRAMLAELGLESWVKTTGGKGLHVIVHLRPEEDYPATNRFSRAVVEHMARTIPQRFVAKSGAGNRVGRIFIDFLRNGQSQSTCEAYSARARPGLGVAMPVGWDELARLAGPAPYTIANAIEHLRSQRADPWAGYWKRPQRLGPAMAKLGL